MSAEWYVRTKQGDGGPYTLHDLLEMIRRGEVLLDDRARREGEVWLPVRRVSALAEETTESEPAKTAPVKAEVSKPEPANAAVVPQELKADSAPRPVARPASTTRPVSIPRRAVAVDREPSWWTRTLTGNGLVWTTLLICVVIGIAVTTWLLRGEPTFPESKSVDPQQVTQERTAARNKQLLATRTKTHLIPGLRDNEPVLVPGLENWKTAFSPTLTPDLKTIVFAALGNLNTKYDLYIADRASVTVPFGRPQLIDACVSPETEAFPSISSDGRSLIFIRSDTSPALFHASRESRDQPFGEAAAWEPAMKLSDGGVVGYPQHLDLDRVVFSSTKGAIDKRKLMVTGRPDVAAASASLDAIPMVDPSCPFFFAKSELRAYFAWDKGVAFALRGQKDQTFGLVQPLLQAEQIGPAEGSVWVTANEDLIFYCSPGVGQKLGPLRRLWMVQF